MGERIDIHNTIKICKNRCTSTSIKNKNKSRIADMLPTQANTGQEFSDFGNSTAKFITAICVFNLIIIITIQSWDKYAHS